VDEDAGPLDVVGDDADVGADQRDQVDARAERPPPGSAASTIVAPASKRVASPLDDGPEDVLLRGDVGVQAGALDVRRARAMSRTLVPE
jgi:hypothetical protein